MYLHSVVTVNSFECHTQIDERKLRLARTGPKCFTMLSKFNSEFVFLRKRQALLVNQCMFCLNMWACNRWALCWLWLLLCFALLWFLRCFALLCFALLSNAKQSNKMSHVTVLCFALLCSALLSNAKQSNKVSHVTVLCFALLCFALLWFAETKQSRATRCHMQAGGDRRPVSTSHNSKAQQSKAK